MPTLDELMSRDPIRAALWGVSGSAKTTLAALLSQYEEFRPIYFFDWDRRLASLRATIPSQYWQYIHTDSYSDGGQQGSAWTKAEAKIVELSSSSNKFKTVIWDSMTFAEMAIMARVLFLDSMKPSTFSPELQHYLSLQSMIKDALQKLCSKPFNFICIFHEANDKDEIGGRLFKAFAINGKLVQSIPGYFNEIWHCEVAQDANNNSIYSVRTRSDYTYMARTSFKSLKSTERQEDVWPKVLAELGKPTIPTIAQS